MRNNWEANKDRFMKEHNGDIDAAAETLCIQTYVSKSKKEEAMKNYKKMIKGLVYTPPFIYRIMDNYCSIKHLKMKKDYMARRCSALIRLCSQLGIDIPIPEPVRHFERCAERPTQ